MAEPVFLGAYLDRAALLPPDRSDLDASSLTLDGPEAGLVKELTARDEPLTPAPALLTLPSRP